MSTFTTSRGTRAQHVAPMYQSAPYRQHPSRRQYIHGPIQPMDRNRNYQDQTGYGSTPADERWGFWSGLLGMGLVVAAAFLGRML